MYQLPFRLADEPEEVQHAVQELPPDHFLNRVPANFLSQSANISSEQHPAAWNAAYHGGSLASAE